MSPVATWEEEERERERERGGGREDSWIDFFLPFVQLLEGGKHLSSKMPEKIYLCRALGLIIFRICQVVFFLRREDFSYFHISWQNKWFRKKKIGKAQKVQKADAKSLPAFKNYVAAVKSSLSLPLFFSLMWCLRSWRAFIVCISKEVANSIKHDEFCNFGLDTLYYHTISQ